MHILVVNGSTVHLTRRELLELMRHRYFVGYFLLILLTVMALEPFGHIYNMDIMTNTLLFIPGCFTYLAIYFGGLVLMDSIGMRPTTFVLWPIASIATASSVILLAQLLDLGDLTAKDLAVLYTFHLVVFFIAELSFVSFLLQPCLKEIRLDAHKGLANLQLPPDASTLRFPPATPSVPVQTRLAEQPAEMPFETASSHSIDGTTNAAALAESPQILTLFGQRFHQSDIWAIRAVEHYIEVINQTGECTLLRGRMSEAEAALPAELGLRVHRSHWVSARALKRLDQKRDTWHIVLQCGATVPVARARRAQTKAWVSSVLGPLG